MTHSFQTYPMLRQPAMLDVQTMLAMLLRNEMNVDDFQMNFNKLSSSERMELLDQLESHSDRKKGLD